MDSPGVAVPVAALLHGQLPRTAAALGHEDRPNSGRGIGRIDGQVGAPEHAEHHLSVLDQRQRNRVLLVAQEALGPVHRIDRPVPPMWPTGVAAPVQRPADGVQVGVRPNRSNVLQHRADQFRRRAVAQTRGRLLADDRVAGKRIRQRQADQRLRGVVRHGDRRLVGLGGGKPGHECAPDVSAHPRRVANGVNGREPLALE